MALPTIPITEILQSVTQSAPLVYGFTAMITFIESIPFLGIISTTTFPLLFVGMAAANNSSIHLVPLLIVANLGAILGDALAYYTGRLVRVRGWRGRIPFIRDHHWAQAEDYMRLYGSMSVFVGRFISPARPFVPFLAGTLHFPTLRFWTQNIFGGIVWTGILIIPGYLFSGHIGGIENLPDYIGYTLLFVSAIFVLAKAGVLAIEKLAGKNKTP